MSSRWISLFGLCLAWTGLWPARLLSDAAVLRETTSAQTSDDSGAPEIYAGRTLDEWQRLMKSLELTSPEAARAVPGLIVVCRTSSIPEQTRTQAAYTLGRIGRAALPAVPVLVDLLNASAEETTETDRWAAKALALFGPLAAEATPALARVAKDESRSLLTRQACLEALGRIGGAHPDAIPTLFDMVTTDGLRADTPAARQLREAAVDSLTFAGPAAAAGVPLLIRLTRDQQWSVRYRATLALSAIGPAADIAAEALAELVLFDDVTEVRDAAATALTRIGAAGLQALSQLLSDPEVDVRRRVARVYRQVSRLDDVSRRALVAALDDGDVEVRLSAVDALQRAKYDPTALFPILFQALTLEERQPRIRSYRLILGMPDEAVAWLPQLEKLADDTRPYVRQVASRLLGELRQTAPPSGNQTAPPGSSPRSQLLPE